MKGLKGIVGFAALLGILSFAGPASAIRYGRTGVAAFGFPYANTSWTCVAQSAFTGIERGNCSSYDNILVPIPTEWRSGA